MNKFISNELANFFYNILDSEDIRLEYSGRGMFGKTCAAFTTDISSIKFVSHIISEMYEYEKMNLLPEFLEWMKGATTDSMGYGVIIYNPYFSFPVSFQQ